MVLPTGEPEWSHENETRTRVISKKEETKENKGCQPTENEQLEHSIHVYDTKVQYFC